MSEWYKKYGHHLQNLNDEYICELCKGKCEHSRNHTYMKHGEYEIDTWFDEIGSKYFFLHDSHILCFCSSAHCTEWYNQNAYKSSGISNK